MTHRGSTINKVYVGDQNSDLIRINKEIVVVFTLNVTRDKLIKGKYRLFP